MSVVDLYRIKGQDIYSEKKIKLEKEKALLGNKGGLIKIACLLSHNNHRNVCPKHSC